MAITHIGQEYNPCLFSVLHHKIDNARFLVAVTGAGISLASGVPLLREEVEGVPLQEFFGATFFHSQPQRYYDVYRTAMQKWRSVHPNAAHFALADRGVWVITQNVDGLHRDAGTTHLIELHGNLRELHCPKCEIILDSERALANDLPCCPQCDGILHPGISLEGQEVRHYSRAVDWIGRSEVLLVVGTSLDRAPVQDLPQIAKESGSEVIWVNSDAESVLPKLLARDCDLR